MKCKYCNAKLTAEKSVKRGVGPECINKYSPCAACQHCVGVEIDLSRQEGRKINWDNVTKRTVFEDWKTYRNTGSPGCTKKFVDNEENRKWGLVGKTHQTHNDWASYEEYAFCVGCDDQSDYVTWDDLWTAEEDCASCIKCRGEV
ncbi:MAG: hypothetical protein CXT67_00070 [Methanobacteriota archaeon]|nr:MAG: hypothetical protein CXT67_00070 [Euryarchaeota archaeon]